MVAVIDADSHAVLSDGTKHNNQKDKTKDKTKDGAKGSIKEEEELFAT